MQFKHSHTHSSYLD